MKIRGYWGRFDAPHVEVRFICQKFGIDAKVRFLIDIGASSTIISEKDAKKLKLDYASLQKLKTGMTGIGGSVVTYLINGVELYFQSDRGLYHANIDHVFAIKHAQKLGAKVKKFIPSLLGRDFLNQMAFLIDKRKDLVLITDEDFTI